MGIVLQFSFSLMINICYQFNNCAYWSQWFSGCWALIHYSALHESSLRGQQFIFPFGQQSYKLHIQMNPTKTYVFFDSKSKKGKKTTQQTLANHSRSLSAKSDLTKNSARNKLTIQNQLCLPLSKKQKQIREAIQYRYKKSKMREYEISFKGNRVQETISSGHSSQMEEFRQMKTLKVVNLKDYHQRIIKKKLKEKEKNSIRNRLRIRTDTSLIIKTEGSEKSMEKMKFLKSFIQPQLTPTKYQQQKVSKGIGNSKIGMKDDWKFISIQSKQKINKEIKSKNKETGKINSHRTLTADNEKSKMKTVQSQSQWDFGGKIKDLTKLNKKYRF